MNIVPTHITVSAPPSAVMIARPTETASRPRIYFDQRTTLTSEKRPAHPAQADLKEERILAALTPWQRVKYLARNNKPELIISIVAVVGGVYTSLEALSHFSYALGGFFSTAASAETTKTATIATPGYSTGELFQWYVALLMGISLLCSWGMTMWSTTESKIQHGRDTNKMIIGFIVGFLSGNQFTKR